MILRGNALTLPLADGTVDLVVTSPPYFGLRSYQDGGEHYAGQIGDEPTPAEFVESLLTVTRECVRVLKPSGSLWVNLGDKYSNGGRTSYDVTDINGHRGGVRTPDEFRPKTLLGIPWRYALACIDDLGLILRAEVIWSKPNGLPESVTDRVRRSHETWFHFTLSPRYYSAVDEIREEHSPAGLARRAYGYEAGHEGGTNGASNGPLRTGGPRPANPLGKLPGSVWVIPTEPLHVPDHVGVDHFAAFPTEFPRRIIQGWSPRGICVECGEGRRPMARETGRIVASSGSPLLGGEGERYGGRNDSHKPIRTATGWSLPKAEKVIDGEACACPELTAPTRPGVVLDPFGGTGTVALVAEALGRRAVHVDMSRDYCRLAQWRTTDPKQLAKAARREYKPPVEQTDGQLDLLEGIA